ncbi:hypothetical protein H0I23_06290 [Cellulophaga sp. HaHaR_3_176]|uniref:phospholipase D-like domain-containing protein n=1 Tax=Cellulophaga sp. HaHaR_3_176 TaxID=1942464 RepID=UPI001C1F42AE|nr:phospholipase D-like domain-containing protein [Cellulophaga sp. HaHaR_3_176]QWX85244.1 hypothetical protein H0I23_06290 [Cellulophaga sp. HaHaR_3_176]
MLYSVSNCDIYLESDAGEKLLNDIRNAKKTIRIISPYLSPLLITELLKFRKRNIEVELITTDNIKNFHHSSNQNIHKLILQNRKIDDEAVEKRKKWIEISKFLSYVGFGLIAILIGFAYYLQDIKVAFGLTPILLVFSLVKQYKNKIRFTKVYSYWYSQLFPFKVYMSSNKNEKSNTFMHDKIYLIDDQIAYLSSLNNSSVNTNHNYETRVRTEDEKAIKKIREEICQMNHLQLSDRHIQALGKQLYREPIN